MKLVKRVIVMALVLSMLAGTPVVPRSLAAEQSTAVIYDLMTNDMVEPVGLDDPAPRFSWKMQDSTLGQHQTAYQLTVKNGETTVWDSGKVESDISVGIVYGGEALLSSTTYSWSVQVWDKDGKVATSDAATFEMGLLEEDAFSDTYFISYDEPLPNSPSVYTIDFDFEITARVLGFIFGAKNENDFLMWQFSSQWGQLRPHKNLSSISGQEVNICQTAENPEFRILQGNGDKSEATYTANKGIVYHARIDVNDKVIKTYLGTTAENMVLISTYTHTSTVYLHRMGVRQAGSESSKLDNLIVRDAKGDIYYENRFEDVNTNDITSANVVLNNGWLEAKTSAGVVLQLTGSELSNYTIDWDFEIVSRAASLLFSGKDDNNFMMWQFNSREGLFRPHVRTNGTWASRSVKIAQQSDAAFHILKGAGDKSTTADTANQGAIYHARAEVRGTTVKTWVGPSADDLTLIDTWSHTTVIPLGKLGFRQGDTVEKSYYDNIVVTDKQGNVIYKNDFSTEVNNDLVGPERVIQDGRLYATGSASANRITLQKELAAKDEPSEKSMPAYRKSITVKQGLVSAKLYSAGLGVYESYINGQRVGRKMADGSVQYEELKPGFTQRNLRQMYSSFDVTWMLQEGENVLGGVVTDGWWKGIGSLYAGLETAYLAKLILTYEDGTQEVVNTDTTWKAERYAALQVGTGIYPGERYDATVYQGWMLPGYDDRAWPNVKINTEFTGILESWDGVPIIVREDLERTPQSMTVYQGVTGAVSGESYGDVTVLRSHADGETITLAAGETLLVDFGQNFAGWEYMELEGTKGTVVTVRHGEWINEPGGSIARNNDGPGGSMYKKSTRSAAASTVYTMSGSGVEAYHPSFSFFGFQYIEITATAAITIHKLRGQVVTSVHNDTSSMVTSDASVNQLLSNARWGMYSNYLSVPTDCPQRNERMGWTGDSQVFSQAGTYLTYAKSFLTKYLQDMRDGQVVSYLDPSWDGYEGSYADTAPIVNPWGSTNYGEAGWSDAGIIIPWYLYMMYGDTSVIEEHWDSMVEYLDVYLASTNGDGPVKGAADHLSPEKLEQYDLRPLLGVTYYAWDAKLMVDMANAIGNTAAAAKYQAVYESQKALFQQRYVLSDGTVARQEQTAFLLAIYLDLLPNQASREAVIHQLVSSIESYGNRMMTGFLGTAIISRTLTQIGRTDLAYALLLQHEYPSWLYTVDQGATTMWERWETYTEADGFGDPSMNSFNHYAYGAVAGWMYETVAGIGFDSNKPGFKNIVLAPSFDSRLPSVQSTYESVYGPIKTSTIINGGTTTYTAAIPANTTAVAKIPVAEDQTLTVNGKALQDLTLAADGIRYMQTANGVAEFEAVAGSFRFVLQEVASQGSTNVDWSNHYCQHCKKNVAWTSFSSVLGEVGENTVSTCMVANGHYYLDKDFEIPKRAALKGCLHLNGKTLANTGTSNIVILGGTTPLNIMDHPENEGVLTAKGDGGTRGCVISAVDKTVLHIYGGTLKPIAGTQTGRGGVIFAEKLAQIHMHGGVIIGGNVKPIGGGSVFLNQGAVFTLHGGTIEGGLAEGKNGGNVYVSGQSFNYNNVDYTGGASFVMEGGTLRGGNSTLGGNIYAEGNATVQIHGGSILYGNADDAGGNIYMASGTTLSIDEDNAETLIDGGVALRGGNIMLAGAGATMDAGDIVSGKAFGTASSDGGANIYLNSSASFTMNQDEGKRSLIRGGFSTLSNYGGNVHNYGTFTMNNGRIDRGVMAKQDTNGANLCNRGTFTMNDGFIGDTVRGYNILLVSKRLTVNGGTVSGGYANGEKSRNVVAWDNSEFFMTGGRLVSNYPKIEGGSLNASKGAILSLTGGTVTGNSSSEISVTLVQADNVKRGTTLTITDASVDSLLLKDDNPTFDTTITISGKAVIGKVTRGGATKPAINFALTEGADVCFSGEALGEVFGSGSPEFIRSDNGLAAVLEGESLKWTDRLTDEALKFTAASVTLYNDLSVNFKVDGSVLAGYEDPFVKFSFGGVETTSEDYVVDSGKYVFRFRDIAPNRIGDTITATLYAYQNGVLCQGATLNYSVKQYCYNILTAYNDVDYPGRAYGELRTLLVDLLNYGAAAQTYTEYNTDALVNGDLLGKQLTWGTATDPAVSNAAAAEDQDVENPAVTWAAVGLTLDEAVTLRLGFLAESTEGLSVKFTLNGKAYEVTEFQDMTTENGHYVYFGELNAAQMRQEITAAVYRNGQQVSNTVHYNVEAYVANHANDGNALAELVKAMIRYGDAAEAFVN